MDENAISAFDDSFLGALSPRERLDIVASARVIDLPPGKLIYDPQLSIIVAGTLRAFVADGSGRHLTLSYLRRSHAIGIGATAGREFPMGFQAVTKATVLRIPQARVLSVLESCPKVTWAATQELTLFYDDVLAELARVAFESVRARVAHHLLALSNGHDHLERTIHQVELAAAVGSVREVVGRTVCSFKDSGLVTVDSAGITAIDREGLRQIAGQWE